MKDHRGTYSPEDNKLRLYPDYRLPKEDYLRLKDSGFKWAPKQELFVAPMWTPQREEVLLEFCDDIEDEDTELMERAEQRSERFSGYRENRTRDAESAHDYVKSITDNIPFGQPILVGHHSEARARRDAKRIESGMRKAVKMWDTAEYWKRRAAGAIRHAKYKERPDVRARRIKKIEAEKRKMQKSIKEARAWMNVWLHPSILTMERAMYVANYCYSSGIWSRLDKGEITPREARNIHVPILENTISLAERWIAHYENRLLYEKAMLEDHGRSDLLKKKPKPKQLPLCNYRSPEGIYVKKLYGKPGETELLPQVEMTKKEYSAIYGDYKGTMKVENSHRVRMACRVNGQYHRAVVFLTDSKVHKKPDPIESKPHQKIHMPKLKTPPEDKKTVFDDMKNSLRAGIKTVSAPQLFPTPKEIARKMINAAGTMAGERILEPSAGTGVLVEGAACAATGIDCCRIVAVELNVQLVSKLEQLRLSMLYANEYNFQIVHGDFLQQNGNIGNFSRIIMNPPFKNGSDIKHIKHAIKFLKPGGRLVALCANGPRQREQLMPIAGKSGGYWEDLPDGSFKKQGTNVSTAMVVIEGPEKEETKIATKQSTLWGE